MNSRELRRLAEARLGLTEQELEQLNKEEGRRLLYVFYDLHTHQVELEMQNEELRNTESKLVVARNRYRDLYDLAPVAYLTLSPEKLILEANLTLTEMIGTELRTLIDTPLSAFIHPQSQDSYHLCFSRIKTARTRQSCELRLQRHGSDDIDYWVQLNARPVLLDTGEIQQIQLSMSDITALKMAEREYKAEHEKLLAESAIKSEEQLKRAQAESSARDAQLQMLRYQLNPHFLFNTLNSITALVKFDEGDRAQEMLRQLANFLRRSLDHDYLEAVSLEYEIETLKLYFSIEKLRFEDRLEVIFDIDPQVLQAQVPSFILQPIVENSLKHAIAASEEGGSIRLVASKIENMLQLEVIDSGPGMNIHESVVELGVGLNNTLERLERLYDKQYSFDATNADPTGLSIRICIPYQSHAMER